MSSEKSLMECFTYVVAEKKNALQMIYLQSAMKIFCDPAGGDSVYLIK